MWKTVQAVRFQDDLNGKRPTVVFSSKGYHNKVVDYFTRLKSLLRGLLKEHWKPPVSHGDGFKILPFRQAFLKTTKYTEDVYQVWKYIVIRFKLSISCLRVWHRMNYDCRSARVRRTLIGMLFTMYGGFCLTVFSDFDCYTFYTCEAHFRAESIGAGPMIIACSLGKLFACFTRILNVNVL